ncbi:MAG: leucine-rich repeat domain-containing protein [Eubacterium sp.]
MTKKIIPVLVLVLIISSVFCGCSKEAFLNALSIDTSTYDPATEMAADVMGKTVSQKDIKSGDFTYLLFSDGTAAVTQYSGSEAVLVIPEQLDGHTVTALENKSLYKSEITELVLPDTLEVVGNYAAMYCEKLEKVTFGENIRNIGVSAFESEGNNATSSGKGVLKTLVWNGAPEIIREKAFYYNDKLTEIVLPNGVKEIEDWAFAKCLSADKIILGQGLELIGDHAFLKCRSAKEIFIPGSCKTVEVSAFYQCTSVEKLTMENGVETLRKGAFEECESLESVVLPNSITVMEPYIFYNCTALKECTMGDVDTLEKDIFTGAESLTVIAPAQSNTEKYAVKNGIGFIAE